MVDGNERYGEDDPKTLGAAIWLAVLDGECSVEEAVAARRGQETPEETAVLRAICGPGDKPASAPIALHLAQTRRGTGRGRALGGMVALLAAAVCLLWVMRLPEPRGEFVSEFAKLASEFESEQRTVASLDFEVMNGQTGHLGSSYSAGSSASIAFVHGETLILRGTTNAAASPSPSHIEVRFGDKVLECKENEVDLALPNFTWHCSLNVQTPTMAAQLPLRVCAKNGSHIAACKDVAKIVLHKGTP